MASRPRTLYEKIWDDHVVERRADGTCLIYIDRHLIHEVTSPQAFAGLRREGRGVRRPDLTLAVPDHNLPTTPRVDAGGHRIPIADADSAAQLAMLEANAPAYGIRYIDAVAPEQGIVHVVGPEQGFSLPGTTIVCGDSHTAAHGGLGALAFGIGTSEVEHVLGDADAAAATVEDDGGSGRRHAGVRRVGQGRGARDHRAHRRGGGYRPRHRIYRRHHPRAVCRGADHRMQHVDRGRRARRPGRPDATTFAYLKGRPMAPHGEAWDAAVAYWRTLPTDAGATYDSVVRLAASDIGPTVTWGTSPEDVVAITGVVPHPDSFADASKRAAAAKSLAYMGLTPGQRMDDVRVENIFIGSCTNSRIEDLRAAAAVLRGRRKAEGVRWAIVVPGSGLVKRQAEAEGLDRVFTDAGLEWREPGCSACLGMNPDKVPPGERCASTSNRNFVGRQGPGARTHLMSPAMAAAAAVTGRLTDVRELVG